MVKKAIIPAAGLGTRMLPATKSVPKEMLTIVDKPVIQYVVEEAIESGITEILIITSRGKDSMRDHLSPDFINADYYEAKGKKDTLQSLKSIGAGCRIEFLEQTDLNGLGAAVYLGKDFVGDDPFAVLLGDTIFDFDKGNPVLAQLIKAYRQYSASVTAIEEVPLERVSRYGIMDGKQVSESTYKVNQWVEKPQPDQAPSQLAIAARYVFTPTIFDCLEHTEKGLNAEVQITDAMHSLLEKEDMYGLQIQGQRFDIGNPLGFIQTNLHFGLRHTGLAEGLEKLLSQIKAGL